MYPIIRHLMIQIWTGQKGTHSNWKSMTMTASQQNRGFSNKVEFALMAIVTKMKKLHQGSRCKRLNWIAPTKMILAIPIGNVQDRVCLFRVKIKFMNLFQMGMIGKTLSHLPRKFVWILLKRVIDRVRGEKGEDAVYCYLARF